MTDKPIEAVTVRDAVAAIERLPEPQREPQDLLALAVQRGADVATLERLMVVRTQLKAEAAKEAYFTALARFQAECPVIKKRKRVAIPGGPNYNYAPLDEIIVKVQPLMDKYGFSVDRDAEIDDKWVTAIVTVHHRLGHSETKRFKVPAETKAGMSPQQKFGAAGTFAERYAFCGALGIRTGDQDTDCAPAPDGPDAIAELRKELWELLKAHRGPENNWKAARQWLVDEALIDPDVQIKSLDVAALRSVINKARQKITQ